MSDRRLAVLAAKIRAEHEAAETAMRRGLEHALKCGDLLIEAQRGLDHGKWLPWLARWGVPERTAQRYMRLAANRTIIEAKSDTVSDLTINASLGLLAKPTPVKSGPPSLNAVGKPYSPQYDPNYKVRVGGLTPISRLSQYQRLPWKMDCQDLERRAESLLREIAFILAASEKSLDTRWLAPFCERLANVIEPVHRNWRASTRHKLLGYFDARDEAVEAVHEALGDGASS